MSQTPRQSRGTNTGIALLQLGRYAESFEGFDRSLTVSPRQSNAMARREEAIKRLREKDR